MPLIALLIRVTCPLGAREASWFYLFAVVGCVGHTHQVLVGPAVQVCVLPTDDAVPGVAGLALAAVRGVAVRAQVVAVGVLVAVVCPVRARVAGFAHLRGQHPDVNTEPLSVSRYPEARRTQTPVICEQALWGRVGVTSVLPILPLQMSRLQVSIALCAFFLKLLSPIGSHLIPEQHLQM